MQKINKNPNNEELKDFFAWLQTNIENGTIAKWLEEKSISEVWAKLIQNPPVKKSLQNGLLQEQYYLCCYCCNLVSSDVTKITKDIDGIVTYPITIEHYEPKSNPERKVFIYSNLLASCDTQASCNKKRGNMPLKYLNPQIAETLENINIKTYKKKGIDYVELDSKNQEVKNEIDIILGLNYPELQKLRGELTIKRIKNLIEQGAEKEELVTLFCKPNQQGKLYPFSFVAEWYINQNYL